MRSAIFYVGGKHELARLYRAPTRNVVVEPFAGGANYSVFHEVKKAILIDKNERLINMWNWLIKATHDDIMDLDPDIEDLTDCDYPQPIKDWIGWSFGSGADVPSMRLEGFKLQHKKTNTRAGSRWSPERQREFAGLVHKYNEWEAHVGNYDMLDDRNLDAHWFVDPPYIAMGDKLYRHNGKSIDFQALGEWCRSKERITVCEGAPDGVVVDWLPFKVLKTNYGSQGFKSYDELVWEQFPESTNSFLTEDE